MPLESCMILLDNSEYMRNGDYIPTRLEAQHDAANLLVGQKTQSNPESTVGVIAMSGGGSGGGGSGGCGVGAELLVSPTDDVGKILSALHGLPYRGGGSNAAAAAAAAATAAAANGGGVVDITASIQVASLALKHRRNKNGSQRVVLFVGSPLSHIENRALVKVGRQLKKNNVAIDVIAMGELEVNEPKLRDLVDAANGSSSAAAAAAADGAAAAAAAADGERTCHLVTIPPGVLPSDVLISSPIVHGGAAAGIGGGVPARGEAEGAAAGGADVGAGAFAEFGGVDPNLDPELAMALRVSMEEERARQERAAAAAATAAAAAADESKEEEGKDKDEGKMEVEEMKAGHTAEEGKSDSPLTKSMAKHTVTDAGVELAMSDEEALLQQALAMSMSENHAVASMEEEEDDNEQQQEKGTSAADDDKKPSATTEATESGVEVQRMDTDEDEDDEDAAMQMALQMSMQTEEEEGEDKNKKSTTERGKTESQQQFQDPQFVNQLLGSLPGVDPNDPAIQNALRNLNKSKEDKKEGEDAQKKDGDEGGK